MKRIISIFVLVNVWLFAVAAIGASSDWVQVGADIDGSASDDNAGESVSLSANGSILAIGAPYNDSNGSSSGHVRVYENVSGTWTQIGSDIVGEKANDLSGRAVSLSADGTIVAIGANQNWGTSSVLKYLGHVRVYKNDSGTWTQMGQDIDDDEGEYAGWSVSLSDDGTVVAIGAHFNDNSNGDNAGHVRVYKWSGASWNQLGSDIDGEATNDNSGKSVSLNADGTVVAIGAHANDNANGSNSGHARVYKWNGASWNQLGSDIDCEAINDFFGQSVSLNADGSIVAIGADSETGSYSGYVKIYKWNGSSWNQLGKNIAGEAASDFAGRAVSLNAAGSIVAIGAMGNDGTNGSNSGQVRVYQWNGLQWNQLGSDIDGEAIDDFSGQAVSLSADGSIVAIGAPYNDGTNGSNSGHTRIFQIDIAKFPWPMFLPAIETNAHQ